MKRLFFNLTLNTRDIGGIVTPNGKVKEHTIIRTDALRFINEEDKEYLLSHNVKTQIDLRTENVIYRIPSALTNDERFNYYNFPLVEGSLKSLEDNDSISGLYLRMIENKIVFYNVFKTFINNEGGMIVSCTAGKDRTGIIVYLLLSLLGAKFDIILEDYVLSDKCINERLELVREQVKGFPKFLGYAKAEYLIEFHEGFCEKYKTVENYLLSVGLTENDIRKIKDKLIEKGE